MSDVKCPYCDSADTIFKEKAQQWECENCERRFENVEDNSVPKRIFLSYPHRPDEHSQLVEDVARVIEEKGHDPWFDKNKITPGYDWRMSITKGVLDSDWMIIFMSEEALRPGGVCLDEVNIALQKSGYETLLTVLLEDEAKANPPISLTRVQWLDAKNFVDYYPKDRNDAEAVKKWDSWLDEEVTKLICHIEKKGDITGQISKLRGRLQPSSFVAEIAHSSQGFVGREWVFEQIETWKEHNRERRTFILQGPAGMGKSAIAAQLSQQMRDVIGIHFCKHNDSRTKDPGNLVRTMAFQIASRNPEYRRWLLDEKFQEEQFKDKKLHTQSAPTLFRELILNSPQINSKSKSRQLLVIDGLDEAFDEQGKNKILELIRDEFRKLPEWLGVVVTTRPEQQIVAALPSSSVLEASNAQNLEDIRNYLSAQFDSIDVLANNPAAKSRALESALEKSEGVMLYAAELVRAMKEKLLDPLIPEQFPVGLSGIYLSFMQRNFADIDTYERTSLKVLELIAASPLPISDRLIRAMLGLSQRTFNQSIKPLSSLLVEGDRNNATTRSVFHKSFADWLIRPESIHDYQLEGDGATQIGEFLYQQYQSFEGIEPNQVTSDYLDDIDDLLPLCLRVMRVWDDIECLDELFAWFNTRRCYRAAIVPIHRTVVLRESELGEEHPHTLASKYNLAVTYSKLGNFVAALVLHEEVLALRQHVLGENHPDSFRSMLQTGVLHLAPVDMESFAETLAQKGDIANAREIQEQVLAYHLCSYGEENQETLESMERLAEMLTLQGDLACARDLQEQVLEIRMRVFGKKHPRTMTIMSKLTGKLAYQDGLLGEHNLSELMLEANRRLIEEGRSDILESMDELMLERRSLGLLNEALAIGEQAYNTRLKVLGEKHTETIWTRRVIGNILFKQGRCKEAKLVLDETLAVQREHVGKSDKTTLGILEDLADTYEALGEYQKAQALREEHQRLSDEME